MHVLALGAGKVCPACHTFKTAEHFGTRTNRKNGRVYLASWCRPCGAAKARTYTRKWRKRNSNASWKYNIKKNYGLTVAQYEQMLAAQGGVCAICKQAKEGKRLAVDHCHTTGQVRGLLCDMCNHGLGRLRDDPELLRRGIAYLEKAR